MPVHTYMHELTHTHTTGSSGCLNFHKELEHPSWRESPDGWPGMEWKWGCGGDEGGERGLSVYLVHSLPPGSLSCHHLADPIPTALSGPRLLPPAQLRGDRAQVPIPAALAPPHRLNPRRPERLGPPRNPLSAAWDKGPTRCHSLSTADRLRASWPQPGCPSHRAPSCPHTSHLAPQAKVGHGALKVPFLLWLTSNIPKGKG